MGQTQPTDGGHAGWYAVLAWWTINFVWVGIAKGLGIMLPVLQEQLNTQAWILGWIASLTMAVGGFMAPLSGFLAKSFGHGYVIMTCGAMIGAAPIVGAFSHNALQLAAAYILLGGMGLAVSNVLLKDIVNRRFSTNFAIANGVARTGYPIGLFLFVPLVQLFLSTYGWRGTMLLVGSISMHAMVCGGLIHVTNATLAKSERNQPYQSVLPDDASDVEQASVGSFCRTLGKNMVKNLDLEIFGNGRYWLVAIMYCTTCFPFEMWNIYFVSQVQSNGFSAKDAGSFLTVGGVGNLVSKLLNGFLTDRKMVSPCSMAIFFTAIISAGYCATPYMTSYWPMMMTSFMILLGNGAQYTQNDVLTREILDVDLLAGAFGWIGLKTSLLSFGFGFIPGWLYDRTNSYKEAFILLGIFQAISLLSLFTMKYLKLLSHRTLER